MAILKIMVLALITGGSLGCLVATPQEKEPAVQGDYDDGDEEHRPGQPCLLCHGPGHLILSPGRTNFELAGTIYGAIDDDEDAGIEDVLVSFTDSASFEFSARTNSVGNFMIDVGGSEISDGGKGWTTIPQAPKFPLNVSISRGVDDQEMKTKIWRNGSCAHCHGPTPNASSVGRVYLFDVVEEERR